MTKKISVVTVCYNAINSIEATILSVLSQNYTKTEYIIIDGGSTDGTVDVIKKYAGKISYFISEPDKGIYDAMNKAISIASGDFINFMNAGDRYSSNDILSRISELMDSEVGVIFGDIIICKNGKKFIEKAKEHEMDNPKNLYMGFNHQASFVQSKLAKEHPFDLRYKLAADFNMMRTIYLLGYGFKYCGFPIAVYDITGVSSTQISKHRYDCLMITNPSHPTINLLRAKLIGMVVYIKGVCATAIKSVFPYLLDKYYSHKSDYKVLN